MMFLNGCIFKFSWQEVVRASKCFCFWLCRLQHGCYLFFWCFAFVFSQFTKCNLFSFFFLQFFSCCSFCTPQVSWLLSLSQLSLHQQCSLDTLSVNQNSTIQLTIDAIKNRMESTLKSLSLYFSFKPQRRTSMPGATPCVFVQPPPGRRALATSSVVPQGSLRKRTRDPRRWMMVKKPAVVGCPRPAGSMFAIQVLWAT